MLKSKSAKREARILALCGYGSAENLHLTEPPLRSLFPAQAGDLALGLQIDHKAPPYDSSQVTDLEHILKNEGFEDASLITQATEARAMLRHLKLTKYAATDQSAQLPKPGYVLIIDQPQNDPSIQAGGADFNRFREMLFCAQDDHPNTRIIIKQHPLTAATSQAGHFSQEDVTDLITIEARPLCPWHLFEGAVAVYTVSSHMGFEAIFADHRPQVFGQPFYAGWDLTEDRYPVYRRQRKLTKTQLFAGAMILYPKWYDPHQDRLCRLQDTLTHLNAQVRAWRDNASGLSLLNMSHWKRPALKGFYGRHKPVSFSNRYPQKASWGNKPRPNDPNIWTIEDGFLRSHGLGAALTPPLSLVMDRSGIYYDPNRPSDLETLIAQSRRLPHCAITRAARLAERLIHEGTSKYNQGTSEPLDLPPGQKIILVPGQVEDDASLIKGVQEIGAEIQSIEALLQETRRLNPEAHILYKPHPDVVAGLRNGLLESQEADQVITHYDAAQLIDQIDELWTLTSTMGFETLIRGKRVVTFGAPFYAGYGLTSDKGPMIARRRNIRPTLNQFLYACLIDYPRYVDSKTGLPCSVEVALDRLAEGPTEQSPALKLLSKGQDILKARLNLFR